MFNYTVFVIGMLLSNLCHLAPCKLCFNISRWQRQHGSYTGTVTMRVNRSVFVPQLCMYSPCICTCRTNLNKQIFSHLYTGSSSHTFPAQLHTPSLPPTCLFCNFFYASWFDLSNLFSFVCFCFSMLCCFSELCWYESSDILTTVGSLCCCNLCIEKVWVILKSRWLSFIVTLTGIALHSGWFNFR